MALKSPWVRAGAIGVVAALIMTGCSRGPSAEVQAFCDAVRAQELYYASDEEDDPAVVATMIDEIESAAPSAVSEAVAKVADAERRSLVEDYDGFDDDFDAALGTINRFRSDECGYERLTIVGADYEFRDVPETIAAGEFALEFVNEGAEIHMISITRISGAWSVDDYLRLFEEYGHLSEEELAEHFTEEELAELEAAFESVGGTGAGPGESDTTFVTFEPGNYAFFCFYPVGATPEALEDETFDWENAPTHVEAGMVATFTVTG